MFSGNTENAMYRYYEEMICKLVSDVIDLMVYIMREKNSRQVTLSPCDF